MKTKETIHIIMALAFAAAMIPAVLTASSTVFAQISPQPSPTPQPPTPTPTPIPPPPEPGSVSFVSGGGWIDSPAGAYKRDLSLAGQASFSFVSQYKTGATRPTGETDFQFQVADLNFHIDTYHWLVVNQNDSRAQFKGEGTINGAVAPGGDNYQLMIWATDGDPDSFRIKIWYWTGYSDVIVYDNGFDPPIGGGSIVVHAPNRNAR